ncbi:MAG: hypothetical protein ACSHX7_09595 [Luteolibacter sp.]
MFFELFGIRSKGVTIYHPELARTELIPVAEELIRNSFVRALSDGQFVSLRVIGQLGGPHNVLLIAHRGSMFYFHDPRSGLIRSASAKGLATMILTRSKKKGVSRKLYFSSYHLVSIGAAEKEPFKALGLGDLPDALEVNLTKSQKSKLAKHLVGNESETIPRRFPEIDFATINSKSVVDTGLPIVEMVGAVNVAKLALKSFETGNRHVLPVWILSDKPVVILGYSGRPGKGVPVNLTLFDGSKVLQIKTAKALEEFKVSGCFLGYASVVRD